MAKKKKYLEVPKFDENKDIDSGNIDHNWNRITEFFNVLSSNNNNSTNVIRTKTTQKKTVYKPRIKNRRNWIFWSFNNEK